MVVAVVLGGVNVSGQAGPFSCISKLEGGVVLGDRSLGGSLLVWHGVVLVEGRHVPVHGAYRC